MLLSMCLVCALSGFTILPMEFWPLWFSLKLARLFMADMWAWLNIASTDLDDISWKVDLAVDSEHMIQKSWLSDVIPDFCANVDFQCLAPPPPLEHANEHVSPAGALE